MGIAPYAAIVITAIAGWAMIKRYQTHLVLILSGMAMVAVAILSGQTNIMPNKWPSTGFVWFDVIDMFRRITMKQASGIGLTVMVAGGFSKYMAAVGASDSLVRLCLIPLRGIKNPYIVLPFAYWLGELCYMVVPSAAGCLMLLLVAVFPVLLGIGFSRPAAAAVLCTCTGLAMGPASGVSILAAQTAGIDPAVYLVKSQLPVALPALIAVPLIHMFLQPYFDRKGGEATESVQDIEGSIKDAPLWYSIFPVLPIILLIIFSPLVYTKVKLNTITALFLVWILVLGVEFIRSRDAKKVFKDSMAMFKGMGSMLSGIVALIIAAEMFGTCLKISGLIDMMIDAAKAGGFGINAMTGVLSGIISIVAFLTGSNVGAFSSFVALSTSIAPGLGGTVDQMVTPMLFAGCIARTVSPVAGVIIICAGAGGLSPIGIVRRTFIPMAAAWVLVMITSFLYF